MKSLVILILFPFLLHAQISMKDIPAVASVFVAGMADGFNQTIEFNYPVFKHHFPNANDNFWNPSISYLNKYKGRVEANGAAFPGSTTYLVEFTDGYHFTRLQEHIGYTAAIVFWINGKTKKKWWQYGIDALESMAANRAGFVLVYDGMKIK